MNPYERTIKIKQLENYIRDLENQRDEQIHRAEASEKAVDDLILQNEKLRAELDEMKGFYQT